MMTLTLLIYITYNYTEKKNIHVLFKQNSIGHGSLLFLIVKILAFRP